MKRQVYDVIIKILGKNNKKYVMKNTISKNKSKRKESQIRLSRGRQLVVQACWKHGLAKLLLIIVAATKNF